MSFKIKPEDVGQKLQDACWIHAKGEGASQRWSISEIINAAIEAGLVSPPCWEVVGPTLNARTVFKRQVDAATWAGVDRAFRKVEVRHWKGQTE